MNRCVDDTDGMGRPIEMPLDVRAEWFVLIWIEQPVFKLERRRLLAAIGLFFCDTSGAAGSLHK